MASSTLVPSSRHHPALKTGPQTSLSPQATLIGSYPITLGASCVIQLRAKLVAVHGPVNAGEGSVICERASVGVLDADAEDGKDGGRGEAVVLEKGVVVECGAVVEARVIGEGSVVEVGAKVGRGAVVGKYCKITPLCVVPPYDILPDRTIVYGGGGEQEQRREEPQALQDSRARVLGKHVVVLRTLMEGNST